MRFLPLILTLTSLGLASCGNLMNLAAKSRAKRQQQAMEKLTETSSGEAESRLGAKAVGEVAYVDDAERFVLIRPLTGVVLPDGAGLETRRDGKRTALLRGTSERKNAFTAADVIEGAPQTGDGVFPSTAKPKPKSAARPSALPAAAPAAASAPSLAPDGALPLPADMISTPAAGDDFDPMNLPPLQDVIKTPEDLEKR